MTKRLEYTDLKNFNTSELINFKSTEELAPYDGMIGQERVKRTLDFALEIKAQGYNIYVCGDVGSGKSTFTRKFAEEKAKTEEVPQDTCYVYNFRVPNEPKLLRVNAGLGTELKKDMESFIEELTIKLTASFSDGDFETNKNWVLKDLNEKRESLIKDASESGKLKNFGIKTTNTGIYFLPMLDGEMITEEEYNDLGEKEKEIISQNSDDIQENVNILLDTIKTEEKIATKKIADLEYSTGLFTVGHYAGKLLEKYKDNEAVIDYIMQVKEDILENIGDFISNDLEEDEDALQAILPWASKKDNQELFCKYKINVIVDNKDLVGAPVIIEDNPTYSNLIGEIEYDSDQGNFITDFMKIKSGAIHRANGGYLILQAHDIFSNIYSWEILKRILRTKELTIEPLKEYTAGISIKSIKPDALTDVNVKVIFIGSHFHYDLIYNYDEEFKKIFKMRVDFDYEMDFNSENIKQISGFIKNFVDNKSHIEFTGDAVLRVIEYFSRLAERKDKLSTDFNSIAEILEEAATWARLDSAEIIGKPHIETALSERKYRQSMYEDKLSSLLEENVIMIDSVGEKIGQVNALAVLDTYDYAFAKPSRVTATTYVGKSGIINIEKEAKMSGNVHDKGVQVLIGYLGGTYAKEFPLSISCRICFEQNYNGIDGDSASSTELYAILSSIAELPISQELAVTGSMNQHGEIQAIGGVTHKIEGFFDLCNKRGLTGNQGVIIPIQNIAELVLKDEVIEAVKNNSFHIYPISHVNDGIELLTNKPIDFIHAQVFDKLKKYSKISSKD